MALSDEIVDEFKNALVETEGKPFAEAEARIGPLVRTHARLLRTREYLDWVVRNSERWIANKEV